jgi:hypothetical protein
MIILVPALGNKDILFFNPIRVYRTQIARGVLFELRFLWETSLKVQVVLPSFAWLGHPGVIF